MSGSGQSVQWHVPGFVPVLSRGKHRRPKQGACFMEFASYLAGEKWSDHPACTHPLLAFLARGVNDFTSDRGRQRLAPLVPSVVGLNGTDRLVDILVSARASATAAPHASESRQRALAAGIVACEQASSKVRATASHRGADILEELVASAESSVPLAMRWAREFSRSIRPPRDETFQRRGRAIISTAVLAAAETCDGDSDAVLAEMLEGAIGDATAVLRGDATNRIATREAFDAPTLEAPALETSTTLRALQ